MLFNNHQNSSKHRISMILRVVKLPAKSHTGLLIIGNTVVVVMCMAFTLYVGFWEPNLSEETSD